MNAPGSMIRVAVLTYHCQDSRSEIQNIFSYAVTPAYYFTEADSPYTFESINLKKTTSYSEIRSLVHSKRFDVFFNLCDGSKDNEYAGEEVVHALEEFNVPFTGADSKHFDPPKTEMKMVAYYNDIKVPNYFVVRDVPPVEELRRLTSALKYPLIVKHPQGYASIGLTNRSKCLLFEDVMREVEVFVNKYQCALVEEFIVGDEVTVLAVATPTGTKVLPPVLVNFPPGEDFKHFNLKWKDYDNMKWVPVSNDDPARAEIERVGKVAFETILGGVGYGRSDLRIDRATNQVYFLEINPNPAVLFAPGEEGSADWILKLDPAFNHRDFIKACIDTALLTHRKRQPLHKVAFDPMKGYHVVAARHIAKGTVVFSDEGRPFAIVTRPYVEANWSEEDKKTFSRYAWPLGNDAHVYAIWDSDPKLWRPINHSCEPNIVFAAPHSLNRIAARDIKESEELTIEYATICDASMKEFDCHCGAPSCRRRITVTEEVTRKYGENSFQRSVQTEST